MDYIIFTEDLPNIDDLNPEDKKFLIKQNLIEEKNRRIYSKFVGEVLTPNRSYFSLPKNIEDESLVEPIKNLLAKYKTKNYKNLLLNTTFTLTGDGNFKSDLYFLKRLKSFFLDFVTYEFIYPLETTKIHSIEPLQGDIDMVSTKINRKIYGDGVTYNVVDKKNNEDWLLDDIYYNALKKLVSEYGTNSEFLEIERMKDYLNDEGYDIKEIDISDYDKMLKEIKKCNVNIVHDPIKKVLMDYFSSKKLGSSTYKINVFFTKNFEYVWENLIQVTLEHKPEEFGEEFTNKFNKTIEYRDYAPPSDLHQFLINNNIKKHTVDPDDKNYIIYKGYDARPDLFSSGSTNLSSDYIDGEIKFVGDGKYYNNLKTDFHKEFSSYNSIMNNEYPMVILAPSNNTFIPSGGYKRGTDRDDKRELLIINISIKDIIEDYIKDTRVVLSDVHRFIIKRCSTRLKNQRTKNKENNPPINT